MKFFKVIDEKLAGLMSDYFEQHHLAFTAMLKFSRKHGGNRKNLGMGSGFGRPSVSIIFPKEPDRSIWKMTPDKSGTYWVPKASKAAAEIKAEFDSLSQAFPSKFMVYEALKYEPFSNGFANFGKYDGVWVMATGDYFKPSKKQQKQIERISDVEYEALLANTVS